MSARGFDGHRYLVTVGDSKTSTGTWPADLAASMDHGVLCRLGVGATTVSYWAANAGANFDAGCANVSRDSGTQVVLYNVGVNDLQALPAEATFKADVLAALDALHARLPDALVFVTRPWKRGFDAEADTVAGWLSDVVATRAWARDGDDERAWFKPPCDTEALPCTYSTDGVHWDDGGGLGQAEKLSQMQAIPGVVTP